MQESITTEINGVITTIIVRRSMRARRMALRAVPEGIELVVPARGSEQAALTFARERGAWILRRLAKHRPPVIFADGVMVPYLGVAHRLRHLPAKRGTVQRVEGDGPEIHIAGAIEHLPRRLGDWLKKRAREAIEPIALEKAARIGKRIARISVRDMRTRWGSCTRSGALAFSWRIVMAPQGAIDWLVAHEVAHLAHMNHGDKFWATARDLTVGDFEQWRAWLRAEGENLLRYGR